METRKATGLGHWAVWGLCLAVVIGEAGGLWWFQSRASRDLLATYPQVLRWLPPGDPLAWREVPVSAAQVTGLSFDRGRHYRVSGAGGLSLDVLYLDFDAGHEAYAYDLLSHPPQYCLGMVGWNVIEVHPDRVVQVAGEPVRVQSLTAQSPSGEVSHVFKSIWIHSRFGFNGQFSRQARVRLALQPMPPPPACIFVAGVSGAKDEAQAWESFVHQGLDGFRQIPSRLNSERTMRVEHGGASGR
ncbi:MAG: hypothetical protein DVB23_000728 [Verrucomicrobia bacterium]|jgi:hypothetical protein|nr:MAG: hypothetical protein DVB23_000728 [Verrucomicrobiota bacterium]